MPQLEGHCDNLQLDWSFPFDSLCLSGITEGTLTNFDGGNFATYFMSKIFRHVVCVDDNFLSKNIMFP